MRSSVLHPRGVSTMITSRSSEIRLSATGRGVNRSLQLWCCLLMLLGTAGTASGQVRCFSWNIAKAIGDPVAIQDVFAAAAADDKPGFAVAPAIIALQEVTSSTRRTIISLVESAIPGVSYAQGIYTSGGGEDNSGGAQLLLYRTDIFQEDQTGHRDIFTGGGRDADRWKLRLVGSSDDAGVVWVYSMHLKANNSEADAAIRLSGAESIRNDADGLPAGSNIVYLGDFNVYSNDEPAYEEFLAPGDGRAEDPLGSGSWGGSSHAIKQTQSPRSTGAGGLIGGGMDDRFDFQLMTEALMDEEGFSMVPGTYRAFGNDGNHYNDSINDGNNTYYPGDISRSNDLADALFEASDHIPVITDWQMPGRMSCVLDGDLGRVVSGGSASINLLVAESRDAVEDSYVDEIEFQATGDGLLLGGGSGVAPRLPSFEAVPFSLAAGVEGDFFGVVTVEATTPGVSYGFQQLNTSGIAVRPARPSWSGAELDQDLVVSASASPDGGVLFIDVPIHNFGWDAAQATLDVDSVSGLQSGFFIWDGLGTQVTSGPQLLRFGFQTDGTVEGVYAVDLIVRSSDEDIPGESIHDTTLRIEVEVGDDGIFGDLNGDGLVDGGDLGLVLGSWGPCRGCVADLDGNGIVDGGDLGLILGAWTF
ncbi:MAG: hypothetical protein CMJ34_08700 [Phycisphaerae bacterium]|nr:hypothetical protein [Phycisphaerae bacterium]